MPSREPSSQPSAHPSHRPSNQPSASPSSYPTPIPTHRISEVEWTARLRETIRNLTVHVDSGLLQTIYSELNFNSNPIAGGCSRWKQYWKGADMLKLLVGLQTVQSVSITTIKQLHDYNEGKDHPLSETITCNVPASAAEIVQRMGGRGAATALDIIACGGNSWKFRSCSVGSPMTVSVCVNCNDPCTVQCSNSRYVNYVSPCIAAGGMSDGGERLSTSCLVKASIHMFSVIAHHKYLAPSIESTILEPSNYSVAVRLTLSAGGRRPGGAYCGVFEPTVVPISLDAVRFQNNFAMSAVDADDDVDDDDDDGSGATNIISLWVDGLIPVHRYSLYCFTTADGGAHSSYSAMRTRSSDFTTACCKLVTATLSSAFVRINQSYDSFLTITLDFLPSSDITIVATLSDASALTAEKLLFPTTIEFSATTSQQQLSAKGAIALVTAGLSPGRYYIQLDFTGTSAHEYTSPLPRVSFEVMRGDDDAAAAAAYTYSPSMVSAVFSADGSTVTVAFDSPTDRGSQLPGFFRCDRILSFVSADQPSGCYWQDDAHLVVVPHSIVDDSSQSNSIMDVGSAVYLKQNTIKSYCDLSHPVPCADWIYSPPGKVVVTAPSNALRPDAVIASPLTLGRCDDLPLDISHSTRSGGRQWRSLSFAVHASTALRANVESIQSYLQQQLWMDGPSYIPHTLLQTNVDYSFALTICNFLKTCRSETRVVTVLNASLPVVSIVGATRREINVFRELKLYADAFYGRGCSGTAMSSKKLQYGWQVKQNNVVMANLSSSSDIDSIFQLPPFLLSVDSVYYVFVQVVDTETDASSESFVRVFVRRGRLVASLGGASSRTISLHEAARISAESSFDQDYRGGSLPASVQFSWSCRSLDPMMTMPYGGDQCGLQYNTSKEEEGHPHHHPHHQLWQVFVAKIVGSSVVTVHLSDDSGRAAAASVTVVVVDSLLPKLSVEASIVTPLRYSLSSRQFVVNPHDKLKMAGLIALAPQSTMPHGTFNSSWTVTYGSEDWTGGTDLSSRVLLTRTKRTIYGASSPEIGIQPMRFDAAVLPEALLGSCAYTFRLVALDRTASVRVLVNAAPLPGTFRVSPSEGMELSTRFSLVALRWQDEDLPLYYTFSYLSSLDDMAVVLAPHSEASSVNSYLPAVTSDPVGSEIVLMVVVEDCLFANASSYRTVTIRRDGQLSRLNRSAAIVELLNSSEGDYRATKQLIAVAVGVINVFNCSGAPANCTVLYNRLECAASFADNVCGACLPAHVGIEGNDNSRCIAFDSSPHSSIAAMIRSLDSRNGFSDISALVQRQQGGSEISGSSSSDGTRCVLNCPNEPFEACVRGVCVSTSKRCPADCSGQGSCECYDANTGEASSDCLSTDPSCEARCNCSVGYFGSSCHLDSDVFSQNSRMRGRLLQSLLSQSAAEEKSPASAASWISSTIAFCRVADELSSSLEAMRAVLSMVDLIFDTATEGEDQSPYKFNSLTTEDLLPLSSALNSLLLGLYRYRHQASARYLTNSSQWTTIELLDIDRLTASLDSYGRLLAMDLVFGQDALSIALSEFRLVAAKLPFIPHSEASSTSKLLPSLRFPMSDLERLRQVAPFQLQPPQLVGATNGGFLISSHVVKSKLLSSSSSSYDNNTLSNPLRVSFTGTGHSPFDATVSSYEMKVVVQYNRVVDHHRELFEETRSLVCYDRDHFSQSYPCRTQQQQQQQGRRFLNLTCPGLPGVLSGRCSVRNASAACSALSLGAPLLSSCTVVASTDFNATCSCRITLDNRRAVLTSAPAEDLSVSTMILQLSSTESVRIDHFKGVFTIDAAGVVQEESRSVLYALSLFSVIIALSVCSFFVIDGTSRNAKVHPVLMQEEEKGDGEEWHPMGVDGSKGLEDDQNPLHGSDSIRRLENVVAQFRFEKAASISAIKDHDAASSRTKDHRAIVTKARLEKSLPPIFRVKSQQIGLLMNELMVYHRWIGAWCHASEHHKRYVRILLLGFHILCAASIEALMYDHHLLSPSRLKTSTCDGLADGRSCRLESDCSWDDQAHSCFYLSKAIPVESIVGITALAAIVSVPIAKFIEFLVLDSSILHGRPTGSSSSSDDGQVRSKPVAAQQQDLPLQEDRYYEHQVARLKWHKKAALFSQDYSSMRTHSLLEMETLSAEMQSFLQWLKRYVESMTFVSSDEEHMNILRKLSVTHQICVNHSSS